MSLLPIIGSGDPDTGFYNGVVANSLRINDGHTLSRAFGAGPTSTTKMSFGGWLKFTSVQYANIFSQGLGGSGVVQAFLRLDGSQRLNVDSYNGSSMYFNYTTNRVLRDFSAWYHIWVQIDSTDNDAGNRVKIYVNGVRETSFATETQISTKDSSVVGWNTNDTHYIGYTSAGASFDGYIADWYFLDGQDVSPIDTVGEFKNGIFIPKEYSSATFGNKGFHLKFIGTGTSTSSGSVANPTNIGDDSSGQNNHWAVTSSTVASHDANLPDCPENNFPTLNSLIKPHGALTFSEGNLKVGRGSEDAYSFAGSTLGVKTGKWYAEWSPQGSQTPGNHMVGISESNIATLSTGDPHLTNGTIWYNGDGSGHVDGTNQNASTFSSSTSYGDNDKIGVALDMDSSTKTVKFYKNGSLVTTKNLTANFTDHIVFANNFFNTNNGIWNFGQDSSFAGNETAQGNKDGNGIGDFYYAPLSGYIALCASNIAEPTIGPNSSTRAINHFGILTYTGNGSGPRTIVSGDTDNGIGGEIDFKPDWLWVKSRNTGYYHGTWDSSRTNKSALYPNANDDEDTSTAGTIGSLNTNGFTTPNVGSGGFINIGSSTYVAWNWKANGGSTSSHSSGDNSANHASVSQANQTAGFSIVTYTGDTSGNPTKMNHGLGKTPRMIIVKSRSAAGSWAIYHENMNPSTSYNHAMFLDTDADKTSAANSQWGGNAMVLNDNLFSVNNSTETNTNSTTYVAYCFAEVEGFSKFGGYTGTGGSGAVDGVFIYTGFRPAFLMTKLVGSGENWHMFDSTRSTSNVVTSRLIADDVTAENNNDSILDFLSNGFKFREGNTGWNGTGSYIYMAFAEAPFKYALAR